MFLFWVSVKNGTNTKFYCQKPRKYLQFRPAPPFTVCHMYVQRRYWLRTMEVSASAERSCFFVVVVLCPFQVPALWRFPSIEFQFFAGCCWCPGIVIIILIHSSISGLSNYMHIKQIRKMVTDTCYGMACTGTGGHPSRQMF